MFVLTVTNLVACRTGYSLLYWGPMACICQLQTPLVPRVAPMHQSCHCIMITLLPPPLSISVTEDTHLYNEVPWPVFTILIFHCFQEWLPCSSLVIVAWPPPSPPPSPLPPPSITEDTHLYTEVPWPIFASLILHWFQKWLPCSGLVIVAWDLHGQMTFNFQLVMLKKKQIKVK